MKRFLLLAIILMFTLTACSAKNKNLVLYGESVHWSAQYRTSPDYNQPNKDENSVSRPFGTMTAVYKGKLSELSSIRKLEYTYEGPMGGGKSLTNFTSSPDSLTFHSSATTVLHDPISKDDVIKMTISLDGKAESLELKVK